MEGKSDDLRTQKDEQPVNSERLPRVAALAPTPAFAGTMAMPSLDSQTMRTLLGEGRPSAWRDQLRPVSADM